MAGNPKEHLTLKQKVTVGIAAVGLLGTLAGCVVGDKITEVKDDLRFKLLGQPSIQIQAPTDTNKPEVKLAYTGDHIQGDPSITVTGHNFYEAVEPDGRRATVTLPAEGTYIAEAEAQNCLPDGPCKYASDTKTIDYDKTAPGSYRLTYTDVQKGKFELTYCGATGEKKPVTVSVGRGLLGKLGLYYGSWNNLAPNGCEPLSLSPYIIGANTYELGIKDAATNTGEPQQIELFYWPNTVFGENPPLIEHFGNGTYSMKGSIATRQDNIDPASVSFSCAQRDTLFPLWRRTQQAEPATLPSTTNGFTYQVFCSGLRPRGKAEFIFQGVDLNGITVRETFTFEGIPDTSALEQSIFMLLYAVLTLASAGFAIRAKRTKDAIDGIQTAVQNGDKTAVLRALNTPFSNTKAKLKAFNRASQRQEQTSNRKR